MTEFVPVALDIFFDAETHPKSDFGSGIVVFTEYQEKLIKDLKGALEKNAKERLEPLEDRLHDIRQLALAMKQFPSLLERTNMTNSVRTPEGLIGDIIQYPAEGDMLLHLPSKASLGRSFLVAKIHTFNSMARLARNHTEMTEKEAQRYNDETVSMMFTLMAEDVYLNLIRDESLDMNLRRQLANSLIILWEHRSDQTIADIAPVLQAAWSARRKLAPAFGTMMGTSELLLVSIQMEEQWNQFIKQRLGDSEVTSAMEEFLFGLSYEQILRLREILKGQGVKAIGRDEVGKYLGEKIKTDVSLDYRDFYLLYTVRRDNARARRRLHLPGPTKTLEDFFIRFILEKEQEKQNNDTFAK